MKINVWRVTYKTRSCYHDRDILIQMYLDIYCEKIIIMLTSFKTSTNKNVIILSQSSNIYMYLKELLRPMGWAASPATSSIKEVINQLTQRQAFAVIVDDSLNQPAPYILRQLMQNMVCYSCPIFSFLLDEHRICFKPLISLASTEIVGKPLTPSRFIPGFASLLTRWDKKPFLLLQGSYYQYLSSGDLNKLILTLRKLHELEEIYHMTSCLLPLALILNGQIEEAEKILLEALQTDSKNLAALLTLGDLYMKHAMPLLAKKLFISGYKSFENNAFLLPDLVQVDLMLGQFNHALEKLLEMRKRNYLEFEVLPMMAKIYLTLGDPYKAESIMVGQKHIYKKIKKSWEKLFGYTSSLSLMDSEFSIND